MIDRYNQPTWSQSLQPHKLLTVHPTLLPSDSVRASIYKFPLLARIRDSPSSFLCNPLLLPLVLHFDPDLVIDVCVQGRGGFRSSK